MSYVNISNNAFPFLDTLKLQFPELNAIVSEIDHVVLRNPDVTFIEKNLIEYPC